MSFNTASYQNGYVQIPFTKIGVCHFSMEGSINDRAVSIMVNVGAPNTVVDLDLARDMNLPMMDLALLPNATSEPGEIYQVQSARFEIANFFPKFPALLAMDLSPLMHSLSLTGTPKVDIIVGMDMLEGHDAVVDYGNKLLCLRLGR